MATADERPTRDPGRTYLAEGIRLFNERRFFDAHEVLETPWRGMAGAEREVYQGIIQVAMACLHAERGRWRSSGALFRRGLARLEAHAEEFGLLPLAEFIAGARAGHDWVEAKQRGEDPRGEPPIPALPELPS